MNMYFELIVFILLLALAVIFSIVKRKLTLTATIVAALLAILIYSATKLAGVALLGTFFLLGILATAWNRRRQSGLTYHETQQRGTLQVLANGGVAGLLAILVFVLPDLETIILLMMACAFSSATADTLSSELGNVYGRRFYNILTLKKDRQGENGVISIEGTLFGIAGSIVIGLVYTMTARTGLSSFIIIIIAGTAGNIADSVSGATLERKNIVGNNAVNFLNTFIAAAVGGVLSY
jgi:uncharacterized protein (TIGR00297 family)